MNKKYNEYELKVIKLIQKYGNHKLNEQEMIKVHWMKQEEKENIEHTIIDYYTKKIQDCYTDINNIQKNKFKKKEEKTKLINELYDDIINLNLFLNKTLKKLQINFYSEI